ncbi:RHS repeat-associated core domain-containing protein [Streptomyces formicae]
MHGERVGIRLSARSRSLTIGALVLALGAGTVSAQAAPPGPSLYPSAAASTATSSNASLNTEPLQALPAARKAGPFRPQDKAEAAATTDNAVYAYDAAGRLVGVTDPVGETARYRYDEAGNRLGIDRYPSTELSVLSLVPLRAQADATVTLSGTGFGTAPASNTVTFGSKSAEVVSASATRLTVKVPQGAGNGKVSVTVSGTTVQSPEAFTLASPGPTIAGVAPTSGAAGAEVVLTGSGFAAALTDNVVRFGGGLVAEVKSQTGTTLTVVVPPGAATGPIAVETPDGTAASVDSFRVVSGGGGQVESSEITSVTDTTPPTVSVTTPGNLAQVLFDADAGADIGFGFTASTFNSSVGVKLVDPQGNTVRESTFGGGTADWEAADLPVSGTYTLLLTPGSSNLGQVTVTVSKTLGGALTFDGPTGTVVLNRAGQDGRWSFDAQAGQSLSIGVDAAQMANYVRGTLYLPDGTASQFLTVPNGEGRSLDVDALPQTGTYTLAMDPDEAATGTLAVTVSRYLDAGVLDPAGAAKTVTLARPGQDGVATFAGSAGQFVNLGVAGTTVPSYASIEIRRPDGSVLDSFTSTPDRDANWDSPALAVSGTYTVRVVPKYIETGSVALTLSVPMQFGALTVGGAALTATVTRAGQDAHGTFTAAVGGDFTLDLTGNSFTKYIAVSVIAPSGTKIVNEYFVYAQQPGTITFRDVPEAGTYRVVVNPSSLATGSVMLQLKTAALAARTTQNPVVARYSDRIPCLAGLDTSSLGWDLRAERCWTQSEAEQSGTSAQQAATRPEAGKTTTPAKTTGIVPTGPDAWQPAKANLAGRDWITARSSAPKAPPALRAPPGSTALTGRVLKLDGKPLAKVTVTVGRKTTRTDTQGRFLLTGISPDATTVIVDGTSANTKQRHYGRFDIRIHPKTGQSVDLGFPVWMSPLDTRHTVRFDAPAKTDVVLTTPKIPGLEVRIPKGSVVRDEKGKPVTELGITAIPIDRAPFPLPKNSVIPVYFTVQPGGTYVFPKGAQIIYPNYTREAPGTRVEFMDYDPKKKGWYVYGHGQVSADGRQVVPDAKTRVWAFHGAMFNTGVLPPWLTGWLKDALDWLSGDPVELSTGMLTDSRTDLAVSDPRGSAEVTRAYWQGDTHKRAFGIGRDLIYNAFLHSQEQYKEVDLYLPGGAKVHYTRTSPGTGYTDAVFEPAGTPSEFRGTKIAWNGKSGWDLTFRDGTVWVFPQYAPLQEIRDRHGNTTRITRLDGTKGDITQVTTPGGRWVSFTYDANHRVTQARDNTGRTTGYTYDTAGRLETVTDPAGKASRYTYDGTSNRIATATDARGITYMTNTFHADGRVKEQTLTEGQKYTFEYTQNGSGQVTSATVTQPGGSVRRVEFDTDGYGVKDTEAYGTSLARATTYQRGGTDHRIDAVVDPYGRRTKLTYNANGHITSTTELEGTPQARPSGTVAFDGSFDQPTRITDPLGNPTTLTYDTDGNLDTVTDPENRVTKLDFLSDGQIQKLTDAADAVTEYAYRNGGLVSVKDAEGRTSGQFLDAAGRPTLLTDEAGAATTVTYDKLNQTRSVTDPLGHAISFGYDDNGNLTTLTDARNNATTWTYDQADRPKTATDPLGSTAGFEYHPAGQVSKVTNRLGQVATADYDLLGRATTTKYGVDLAGQAESTVAYAYDTVDLPKTLTDTTAGTQSFIYDVYDRLKAVTGPTGTVGYDYDAADRRKEMTAAGTTTTYGYDKSDLLTSIITGSQSITFGLDTVGREKTANLPGGITRTTGYDKTGIIKTIAYARGTTPIGDLTYTRDGRGLQTGLTGTLASIAIPAAETGAVFGKDNRLTTFNGRTFTYDNEGQLTNDGQRTYTWNARGQLTGLTQTGGSTAAFGYDPLGTRTSKTLAGTTHKYLTDASNPHIEQNSSGETAATVTASGLDEYLTRTENGQTQVYLTDALGTVVGLANQDGTIATRYTYDPYGQPTTTGTPSANPYTFTGRESDGTGLLYYRNRYYDPQTGRFISQDPIGHAGGLNLYQYALSSPTTYTDPSGNNPLLAGCVGGALFDGAFDWGIQRLSGRKVNWGQVGRAAAMGCAFGMLGAWGGLKWANRGGCNSFTPDTPVLMADGTRKPIKGIKIGDKVLATDPKTGETSSQRVTALIIGGGEKHLVDITIDSDGPKPEKLTATDGHPFWVPQLRQWVDAADLKVGQWLQTSAGTYVQVSAVSHRTEQRAVYNLTIERLHTYYALAGNTPLLVHNTRCRTLPSTNNDKYVVLGDYEDTTIAINWPDHEVLFMRNWSIDRNDEFIRGVIEKRQTVYLGTPINTKSLAGVDGFDESVYARELNQLLDAGYTFSREGTSVYDYMIPPPLG